MHIKHKVNEVFGQELRLNVNFIIPDREGNILLFHRFCKKSLAESGQDDPWHPSVEKWYDIPGGRVDDPEIHIRAIKRELEEELNINTNDVIHLTTMPNPAPKACEKSTRDIYVVMSYQGEPVNKAGYDEGHLGIVKVKPWEVIDKVGSRIDYATSNFLTFYAEGFFQNMRLQNQPEIAQNIAHRHPELS